MVKKTKITRLEKLGHEKAVQAMPFLLFMLGIIMGIVLNLFSDILREDLQKFHYYRIIVSYLTVALLAYFFYIFYRYFIKPLDKIDKKLKLLQLKKGKGSKK